jgi:hypothetical protein
LVTTELLVIGAGPYGLSTAGFARAHGIETLVLGRPMGFWRDHMLAGMFLRSGVDWHLDAAGIHTLEAYLSERGIAVDEVDPLPIGLFLDYVEWFRRAEGLEVREDLVVSLEASDRGFEAELEDGRGSPRRPWSRHLGPPASRTFPRGRAPCRAALGAHTCDLVSFDDFAGARVLVVGGRQSAYLAGVLEGMEIDDGSPMLDEAFGTTVPGLYTAGFLATRSFGPFFGFVRGAPAAATLIVRGLLERGSPLRAAA